MYAVVGCRECSALWVVEGRPDSSECPRCGHRRSYDKLRKFVTTEDRDHAREVRGSMLASRQGEGDAFAQLDSYAEMESRVEEAGVDDEEYLSAAGLDPDAVSAAGDRVREGTGGSGSRTQVVESGVRECDPATESAVVEYAADRGVDPDAARTVLERLVRSGEAMESGDGYRLL